MRSKELSACPFCGSKSDVKSCGNYAETWVRCFSCGATGPSLTDANKAWAAWNTRVRFENEGAAA